MKEDYKKYLDPAFVSTFSNLSLTTRMVLKGFMLGIHSSPMKGFSAEFSEHKQYNDGDSTRFVDWKIFGRTEKYFLKQFEDETNIYANIFLDRSASMSFRSEKFQYSKLDYGKQLAAAISTILINQKDAVGFGNYADTLKEYIPQRSSKQHLKNILINIENDEVFNTHETYASFDEISMKLHKSGILVILSDLLEESDKLISRILTLQKRQQDIIVFMIADDDEYNLQLGDHLNMIDSETNENLIVKTALLKKKYKEIYDEHINKFKKVFTEKKIYFTFVTTRTPFHIPLREIVLVRGKK
ncbi:TPA: hypothetical protein DCR49_03120 [Candidatus Delongbacteria bacterium]|nr:MAG: hypothetical protein A2Y39_05115 [Candidatus Delongbacteria bacterium GWF2_40_14]HAQ60979.1 hypothetical protein [Candidatus Delongbacteria bacterium]